MTEKNPGKISIYSLDKDQLKDYFQKLGLPTYRWKQVWEGLYKSFHQTWDAFSTLPKDLRNTLGKEFSILPLSPIDDLESPDGKTRKVLFHLDDENPVEVVLMHYEERNSICISSQSGCPVGCTFCATGTLGLKRNLNSAEIIGQVLYFQNLLKEKQESISNIVIMGMGEPFLNYEETKKAIQILHDDDGMNLGSRRITLSTIGIPETINSFAVDFPQVNLAVSLHTADDEKRSRLIPINRNYPIDDVINSLRNYQKRTNRRITIEYVMIAGINDSTKDADLLGKKLKGLLCHVNLIPLNPNKHYEGKPSSRHTIEVFKSTLSKHHIPTTIRFSKGTHIQAGCGQLAGERT